MNEYSIYISNGSGNTEYFYTVVCLSLVEESVIFRDSLFVVDSKITEGLLPDLMKNLGDV